MTAPKSILDLVSRFTANSESVLRQALRAMVFYRAEIIFMVLATCYPTTLQVLLAAIWVKRKALGEISGRVLFMPEALNLLRTVSLQERR